MPLNEVLAAAGLFAIGVVFVLLTALAVLADEDPLTYELLPQLKMGKQALSGTPTFGDADERMPDEVFGHGCLRWSGSWNGHERERAECSRAELQGRSQRLESDLWVIEGTRGKGVKDKPHGRPLPGVVYNVTDCKSKLVKPRWQMVTRQSERR